MVCMPIHLIYLIVLLCICSPHWPLPQRPTGTNHESVKVHEDLQKTFSVVEFCPEGRKVTIHHVITQPRDAKCSQKSQVMLLIRTLLRAHCSSPGLYPSRDIFIIFVPMDICLCSLFSLCGMFQDSFWKAECLSWFWVTQCTFC